MKSKKKPKKKQQTKAKVKMLEWNSYPKIGWWLEADTVKLYYGTHMKHVEEILENGLKSTSFVSLALDPNAALGKASINSGHTMTRPDGTLIRYVPMNERVVVVLEIPSSYIFSQLNSGLANKIDDKLVNKNFYDAWVENHLNRKKIYSDVYDQEYYGASELHFPKSMSSKFITGYMVKEVVEKTLENSKNRFRRSR